MLPFVILKVAFQSAIKGEHFLQRQLNFFNGGGYQVAEYATLEKKAIESYLGSSEWPPVK
jgi:hypothetical protein